MQLVLEIGEHGQRLLPVVTDPVQGIEDETLVVAAARG